MTDAELQAHLAMLETERLGCLEDAERARALGRVDSALRYEAMAASLQKQIEWRRRGVQRAQ